MRGPSPRTLLRLYPRPWRKRYGDELVALLEREGTGPRVVLSVIAGALDAWVSPRAVDRYAPADAYTLRFWRVPMPPDNRTYRERVPQMLGALAIFGVVTAVAVAAGVESLERAALVIGTAVAMVPFWYEGYSLRTKAVAALALAALSYGLTLAMMWLWP